MYDIEGCKMLSRRVTTRRARSLVSGPWLRADHNHWAHPRPGSTSQALAPATSLRHLYSGTSSLSLQSPVTAEQRIDPWCPLCPLSLPAILPGLAADFTADSHCVKLQLQLCQFSRGQDPHCSYNALMRCRKCRRLNIILTILRHHNTRSLTIK